MKTLRFDFPLPRVHTGVHLANGRMGLLVWGEETLNVTIAHAGFWDRRGARPFATPLTYAELKEMLLGGREEEVRAAFTTGGTTPYQIGGGRLELALTPISATLHLDEGRLVVETAEGTVEFVLSMDEDVCEIVLPGSPTVALRPAWEWIGASLGSHGVAEPMRWSDDEGFGFVQTLPEDEALVVAVERTETGLRVGSGVGVADVEAFRAGLREASALGEGAKAWWTRFWSRLPEDAAHHADPIVREALAYGIWKLGGLTPPGGVAATLQGPWMEEHRLPLWSNDYHFNINLEMVYWPCLHLGLGDHLRPLWTMIHRWFPQLRANGEHFFGVPSAMMLPHAVDDRCHPIGSYWQGTVDHASTAWIAQLAWLDYERHQDPWVLREIAWPLLNGAFEGFQAMLEADGESLRLPISVSPEYGEGAIGTWGANASFQLAAIHMLCRLLPAAALACDEPNDPRWADVAARLPKYSLIPVAAGLYDRPGSPPKFRIALWEGQDLDESHRHHSHLAGLYPFDVMDASDEPILKETLSHWAGLGAGAWSSWAAAWAVAIMARAGWRDGARAWLRFFVDATRNEGGSLSGNGSRGCLMSWGSAEDARLHAHEGDFEVMQLDANMGLLTAAHEVRRLGSSARPPLPE